MKVTRDAEPAAVNQRSRTSSVRGLVLPVLLILVMLLVIWGVRVVGALNSLQADMQNLQGTTPETVLTSPSAQMDGILTRTARDLQELRSSVGPLIYVLPALGWLPRYGGDLANAPAILDLADSTMRAALDTTTLGGSIEEELKVGRTQHHSAGVAILNVVQTKAPLIEQVRQNLKAAQSTREAIDSATLSSAPRDLLSRFDRWLPTWQMAIEALTNAPSILGADRPRTYLLIAQNSDELRATGGFISAVSLVNIDRGEITTTGFQDSFAVDDLTKNHPEAPAPLLQYMWAWQWTFRDGNWSPDVPTSARQLIQLYAIDRGLVADGVIAINLQAVPTLLPALGALELEGEDGPVNAENVAVKIQENWTSPLVAQGQTADWWSHRKDFLGSLFQSALDRLLSGEFDQGQLLQGISTAVLRRDLWVFLDADGKQSEILFPADRAQSQRARDNLMLVDSNVGFNKVDGRITRAVEYWVRIDPLGSATSTTAVTYANTSVDTKTFCVHQPLYATTYADLQQGCYWDYVRVVAPASSRMLSSTGISSPVQDSSEKGRSVFGGYLILPRGETREVTFTYAQPRVLSDGMVYSLYLERQSGTSMIPVRVHITPPSDWQVKSTNVAPVRTAIDNLEYAVTLDQDQIITVAFEPRGSFVTAAIPVGSLIVAALGVIGFRLSRLNRR